MKKIRIGVIAAAGKGTRAWPRTTYIPKPLFRIEGKSVLEHNVDLLLKEIGVEKIYVIVGHLAEQVRAETDFIRKKLHINIETHPWTRQGLAADVASLEEKIQEPFLLVLGDEYYYKPDHKRFLQTSRKHTKLIAAIGVTRTSLLSRIRKNYAVELEGDKIHHLVEKPEVPPNQLLGLGSYLFSTQYFIFFKKTPPSIKSGVVEITEVIDLMARESNEVYATILESGYYNINSMQDYHHAVYEIRNDSFKKFKKTLIIPATNNSSSLQDVLVDFGNMVDEIIVVDGGSVDASIAIAQNAGVKKIIQQKNGRLIQTGLEQATGDIIIVVAADGSFRAKDFPKLMEYMKDSDMVVGTRTTRQMIEQGANLGTRTRLVSLIAGKLIEIFWWGQEPRFTDADCHFFSVWKESWQTIQPRIQDKDRYIVAELMIEFVRSHMRVIEVPVSYFKAVNTKRYSFRISLMDLYHIIVMIFKKKFSKI